MIIVSEQIENAINQDTRMWDVKFYNADEEVDIDLVSLTICKGACGDFTVGSIFIPYITVTCNGSPDIADKELLLKLGVMFDDTFLPEEDHYIDMGYFFVHKDDVEVSIERTTFTAVGKLSKLSSFKYIDTEPRTLTAIIGRIENITEHTVITKGLTLDDTVITKPLTGLTCRDVLGIVASCVGGFVTEDNAGNIVLARYGCDTTPIITVDRMQEFPLLGDTYTLETFAIIVRESYTDSDGVEIPAQIIPQSAVDNPSFTIKNEYMTESLYSKFYANLHNYSFNPGDVDIAMGDPRLEPWDMVSIVNDLDNLYPSETLTPEETTSLHLPCHFITWTFDGGLSMNITADIKTATQKASKGFITSQLDKLNQDILQTRDYADKISTDAGEQALQIAKDYTDGTLSNFIEGQFADLAEEVSIKITTYYTADVPTGVNVGDIWYCTATTGVYSRKSWRWSGEQWQEIDGVPTSVMDELDGKAQLFYQPNPPTEGMKVRDIWIDTDDTAKTMYVYNGTIWVTASDYSTAINTLSNNLATNYSTTDQMNLAIAQAIAGIDIDVTPHMYVAYSNNEDGSNFDYTSTDRQYRGVYVTTAESAPALTDDPALFNWDINPTWAARVASDYLYKAAGGVRIYPSANSDGNVYLGLTATQLQFAVGAMIRASLGYDETFQAYGLLAEHMMVKGSGASVRFDNGKTDATQGQFILETRNNGHLSLKIGLTSGDDV